MHYYLIYLIFGRFSPVDQVVVTSSADCTIKLWSVANLTCLKTFEGHESSVLRAEFVSKVSQSDIALLTMCYHIICFKRDCRFLVLVQMVLSNCLTLKIRNVSAR